MARLLTLVVLVAALLAVPLAASAQSIVGPVGPGGLLYVSTASVSASTQVATAQSLFSQTVSPSLIGTVPVRLSLRGLLGTAPTSAGTMTIACSYGGTSLTIVNAQTLTTNTNVPIYIDYTISPTSTGGLAKAFYGRVSHVDTSTTDVLAYARTTATLSSAAVNTLACTATFTSTNIGTGIIINSAALTVGTL